MEERKKEDNCLQRLLLLPEQAKPPLQMLAGQNGKRRWGKGGGIGTEWENVRSWVLRSISELIVQWTYLGVV
jgi:hypothetical protein